jgi:hypothetical protein
VAPSSSNRTRVLSGRTGVLVMRGWIEPEHETALRVRIIQSVDDQAGGGSAREQNIPMATTAAATVEDAMLVVRSWLEDFVAL